MQIKLTNYTFDIPEGKSVVVFANYRTGSTALCDLLSKRLGIDNIDETFHFKNKNSTQFLDEYYKKKPVIIKVMPDQPIPNEFKDEILDNYYAIGIYRKDFVKQVISFGVSRRTLVWHQKKSEHPTSKVHGLKIGSFHVFVPIGTMIAKNHKLYTGYREHFDCEVVYENIINDLHESQYNAMPKNENYHQWIKEYTDYLINAERPTVNE